MDSILKVTQLSQKTDTLIRFIESGKKGNHDWIIEFSKEPKNINDFMSDWQISKLF